MRLLSPENIKSEKIESIRETAKMNEVVANASAALNKELNLARDKAYEERRTIENETKDFIALQESKCKEALAEVEQLESRRKAALEPLNAIKQEAQDLYRAAKALETQNEAKALRLEAQQENINEDLEVLANRKGDIYLDEQRLLERENKIIVSEKKLAISAGQLSNKWIEYHKLTHDFNKEFSIKNADLKIREESVQNSMKDITKRQKEQDDRDRALTDKYQSLQRAVEEHKKNGIITTIVWPL